MIGIKTMRQTARYIDIVVASGNQSIIHDFYSHFDAYWLLCFWFARSISSRLVAALKSAANRPDDHQRGTFPN